jgi:hypothetical protein
MRKLLLWGGGGRVLRHRAGRNDGHIASLGRPNLHGRKHGERLQLRFGDELHYRRWDDSYDC